MFRPGCEQWCLCSSLKIAARLANKISSFPSKPNQTLRLGSSWGTPLYHTRLHVQLVEIRFYTVGWGDQRCGRPSESLWISRWFPQLASDPLERRYVIIGLGMTWVRVPGQSGGGSGLDPENRNTGAVKHGQCIYWYVLGESEETGGTGFRGTEKAVSSGSDDGYHTEHSQKPQLIMCLCRAHHGEGGLDAGVALTWSRPAK